MDGSGSREEVCSEHFTTPGRFGADVTCKNGPATGTVRQRIWLAERGSGECFWAGAGSDCRVFFKTERSNQLDKRS